MNKLITIGLTSVLLFSCQKQAPIDQFLISGNISGLASGQAILRRFDGESFKIADSTVISNGRFQFIGHIQNPELYRIFVRGYDSYIPVFIDKSEITIKADTGSLYNAIVTGSISDSIYKKFCRFIDSTDMSMQPTVENIKQAEIECNASKVKIFESSLDSAYARQLEFTKQFVKENNKSTVALFVLYKYLSGELSRAEIEKLYANIDSGLINSTYANCIKLQIEIIKRTEIGQKATDFSLPDTSGNSITLSSFLGKYVLVDFWASWCPSCRDENPNVVKAFNKYKNKGFTVLGISFDTKHDRWLKAVYADKLTWTHLSDLRGWENAVGNLYGIRAIPSNLLISPDGKIIAKNIRGKALQDKLKEIIH
jgi:peroxiredoxin